jgi:hypothetical protein
LLSAYCTGLEYPGIEISPVLHYLLVGESVRPDIPDNIQDFVADTIGPGLRAMRDLLQDPEENTPLPENQFQRRESGLCPYCNYGALCESD